MSARTHILKTYKLYLNGSFPRSESGRSIEVRDTGGSVVAHASRASRKDLRNAVAFALAAQPKWAARPAYNRGQILYRLAEMLESRRDEFAGLLRDLDEEHDLRSARREVEQSVDRLVGWAGWSDKITQAMGCHNPVAGPYYCFTSPEPTGVVGVVCPDRPALLGLVTLLAPAICTGSTAVVIGSQQNPLVTSVLGEVCAVSDVPPGVINLLTGERGELVSWLAEHRAVNGIHAGALDDDESRTLRLGAAENLKRVILRDADEFPFEDDGACESPWFAEPLLEMKTIWHPSAT